MEQPVIITIGRQFGAGGRLIAAAAGEKLGIPVYNNELLTEAAKANGYSPSLFKSRDEKRHLFSFSSLFSTQESNTINYMSDNALFQMQCETIKEIADKGSCIILGRCADYILRERKNLFRVFISASMPDRIARTMERQGVDEQTARKIIARKDKDRANFYNGYTLGKWGWCGTYDLCVNSSRLGIDGCTELIIEGARKCGLL